MDKIRLYRNLEAPDTIEPRIIPNIKDGSGNIYESLNVISKRANQVAVELKDELHKKLEEFNTTNDTLEEVLENSEKIQISKNYEKLPHATILATEEFLESKIRYRYKDQEESK